MTYPTPGSTPNSTQPSKVDTDDEYIDVMAPSSDDADFDRIDAPGDGEDNDAIDPPSDVEDNDPLEQWDGIQGIRIVRSGWDEHPLPAHAGLLAQLIQRLSAVAPKSSEGLPAPSIDEEGRVKRLRHLLLDLVVRAWSLHKAPPQTAAAERPHELDDQALEVVLRSLQGEAEGKKTITWIEAIARKIRKASRSGRPDTLLSVYKLLEQAFPPEPGLTAKYRAKVGSYVHLVKLAPFEAAFLGLLTTVANDGASATPETAESRRMVAWMQAVKEALVAAVFEQPLTILEREILYADISAPKTRDRTWALERVLPVVEELAAGALLYAPEVIEAATGNHVALHESVASKSLRLAAAKRLGPLTPIAEERPLLRDVLIAAEMTLDRRAGTISIHWTQSKRSPTVIRFTPLDDPADAAAEAAQDREIRFLDEFIRAHFLHGFDRGLSDIPCDLSLRNGRLYTNRLLLASMDERGHWNLDHHAMGVLQVVLRPDALPKSRPTSQWAKPKPDVGTSPAEDGRKPVSRLHVFFQMEDDPDIFDSGPLTMRRHRGSALWVQLGSDGTFSIVEGAEVLGNLAPDVSIKLEVDGHGRTAPSGTERLLAVYSADALADRLAVALQELRLPPVVREVTLVSCALESPALPHSFASQFLLRADAKGYQFSTAVVKAFSVIVTGLAPETTRRTADVSGGPYQSKAPERTFLYQLDPLTKKITVTDKYPAGTGQTPSGSGQESRPRTVTGRLSDKSGAHGAAPPLPKLELVTSRQGTNAARSHYGLLQLLVERLHAQPVRTASPLLLSEQEMTRWLLDLTWKVTAAGLDAEARARIPRAKDLGTSEALQFQLMLIHGKETGSVLIGTLKTAVRSVIDAVRTGDPTLLLQAHVALSRLFSDLLPPSSAKCSLNSQGPLRPGSSEMPALREFSADLPTEEAALVHLVAMASRDAQARAPLGQDPKAASRFRYIAQAFSALLFDLPLIVEVGEISHLRESKLGSDKLSAIELGRVLDAVDHLSRSGLGSGAYVESDKTEAAQPLRRFLEADPHNAMALGLASTRGDADAPRSGKDGATSDLWRASAWRTTVDRQTGERLIQWDADGQRVTRLQVDAIGTSPGLEALQRQDAQFELLDDFISAYFWERAPFVDPLKIPEKISLHAGVIRIGDNVVAKQESDGSWQAYREEIDNEINRLQLEIDLANGKSEPGSPLKKIRLLMTMEKGSVEHLGDTFLTLYPEETVWIAVDQDKVPRIVAGAKLLARVRPRTQIKLEIHGHGDRSLLGDGKQLSSHTPEELVERMRTVLASVHLTDPVHRITLLSCKLANAPLEASYAARFLRLAIKNELLRPDGAVTAYGAELGFAGPARYTVDDSGQTHQRAAGQTFIFNLDEDDKVVWHDKYGDQGYAEATESEVFESEAEQHAKFQPTTRWIVPEKSTAPASMFRWWLTKFLQTLTKSQDPSRETFLKLPAGLRDQLRESLQDLALRVAKALGLPLPPSVEGTPALPLPDKAFVSQLEAALGVEKANAVLAKTNSAIDHLMDAVEKQHPESILLAYTCLEDAFRGAMSPSTSFLQRRIPGLFASGDRIPGWAGVNQHVPTEQAALLRLLEITADAARSIPSTATSDQLAVARTGILAQIVESLIRTQPFLMSAGEFKRLATSQEPADQPRRLALAEALGAVSNVGSSAPPAVLVSIDQEWVHWARFARDAKLPKEFLALTGLPILEHHSTRASSGSSEYIDMIEGSDDDEYIDVIDGSDDDEHVGQIEGPDRQVELEHVLGLGKSTTAEAELRALLRESSEALSEGAAAIHRLRPAVGLEYVPSLGDVDDARLSFVHPDTGAVTQVPVNDRGVLSKVRSYLHLLKVASVSRRSRSGLAREGVDPIDEAGDSGSLNEAMFALTLSRLSRDGESLTPFQAAWAYMNYAQMGTLLLERGVRIVQLVRQLMTSSEATITGAIDATLATLNKALGAAGTLLQGVFVTFDAKELVDAIKSGDSSSITLAATSLAMSSTLFLLSGASVIAGLAAAGGVAAGLGSIAVVAGGIAIGVTGLTRAVKVEIDRLKYNLQPLHAIDDGYDSPLQLEKPKESKGNQRLLAVNAWVPVNRIDFVKGELGFADATIGESSVHIANLYRDIIWGHMHDWWVSDGSDRQYRKSFEGMDLDLWSLLWKDGRAGRPRKTLTAEQRDPSHVLLLMTSAVPDIDFEAFSNSRTGGDGSTLGDELIDRLEDRSGRQFIGDYVNSSSMAKSADVWRYTYRRNTLTVTLDDKTRWLALPSRAGLDDSSFTFHNHDGEANRTVYPLDQSLVDYQIFGGGGHAVLILPSDGTVRNPVNISPSGGQEEAWTIVLDGALADGGKPLAFLDGDTIGLRLNGQTIRFDSMPNQPVTVIDTKHPSLSIRLDLRRQQAALMADLGAFSAQLDPVAAIRKELEILHKTPAKQGSISRFLPQDNEGLVLVTAQDSDASVKAADKHAVHLSGYVDLASGRAVLQGGRSVHVLDPSATGVGPHWKSVETGDNSTTIDSAGNPVVSAPGNRFVKAVSFNFDWKTVKIVRNPLQLTNEGERKVRKWVAETPGWTLAGLIEHLRKEGCLNGLDLRGPSDLDIGTSPISAISFEVPISERPPSIGDLLGTAQDDQVSPLDAASLLRAERELLIDMLSQFEAELKRSGKDWVRLGRTPAESRDFVYRLRRAGVSIDIDVGNNNVATVNRASVGDYYDARAATLERFKSDLALGLSEVEPSEVVIPKITQSESIATYKFPLIDGIGDISRVPSSAIAPEIPARTTSSQKEDEAPPVTGADGAPPNAPPYSSFLITDQARSIIDREGNSFDEREKILTITLNGDMIPPFEFDGNHGDGTPSLQRLAILSKSPTRVLIQGNGRRVDLSQALSTSGIEEIVLLPEMDSALRRLHFEGDRVSFLRSAYDEEDLLIFDTASATAPLIRVRKALQQSGGDSIHPWVRVPGTLITLGKAGWRWELPMPAKHLTVRTLTLSGGRMQLTRDADDLIASDAAGWDSQRLHGFFCRSAKQKRRDALLIRMPAENGTWRFGALANADLLWMLDEQQQVKGIVTWTGGFDNAGSEVNIVVESGRNMQSQEAATFKLRAASLDHFIADPETASAKFRRQAQSLSHLAASMESGTLGAGGHGGPANDRSMPLQLLVPSR